MKLDKKVSGGEVKFVLAQKFGRVVWAQRVSEHLVHQALEFSICQVRLVNVRHPIMIPPKR